MFRPNTDASLHSKSPQRDLWGAESWEPATPVRVGVVDLDTMAVASTVRADSSASRGAAEDLVAQGKVLLPAGLEVHIGDVLEIDSLLIEITTLHNRRNTRGLIDHIEARGRIRSEL